MNEEPKETICGGWGPRAVLKQAIEAVPSMKYALGVLGLVGVAAIIASWRVEFKTAIFGAVIILSLMVAVLVFAKLTKLKNRFFVLPALLFMWAFVLLTVLAGAFLFTTAAFKWPPALHDLLFNNRPPSNLTTRPHCRPPELPPGCSNVFVSFGNQRMTIPLVVARMCSVKVGTQVPLRDLPAEFRTNFSQMPGFSSYTSNIFVRLHSVKATVGEHSVDYPISPYVKDNCLFVYVDTPFQNEKRMISMSNDLDAEIPQPWDRNYTSNAFEVVREDGNPVLQVFYRRSNEIQVNGIFVVNTNSIYASFGGIPLLMYPTYKFVDLGTTQEVILTNIIVSLELDTNAVYGMRFTDQKPIFRYPSWKYPGQYADVSQ